MDRARKVSAFWSWLPAFRAVAEAEHLPTASKLLHVTPSSLSRTIGLLEREVGQPLFARSGRRIQLNDAGGELLKTVRYAMRLIHEGLLQIEGQSEIGPVHISAPGPFVPIYVFPILEELAEKYPQLIVHLHAQATEKINHALKRGEIDIALLDDPIADEELALRRLYALKHDVFVASGAPLRPVKELSFVAPVPNARGFTPDAWPLDRERKIGLRVTRMQVAIDAVCSGPFAAVLPIPVGESHGLKPYGMSAEFGTTTLYLLHRPLLEIPSRIDLVIDALLSNVGLKASMRAKK